MIEFDCQHCGNHFVVEEKFAGHDGWCRVCKRFIIVPQADGSGGRIEDLSPAEKCFRVERTLRYAAKKAQRYRLLLQQYTDKDGRLVSAERFQALLTQGERAPNAASPLRNGKQREHDTLTSAVARLTERVGALIEARDALETENSRLTAQRDAAQLVRAERDRLLDESRATQRDLEAAHVTVAETQAALEKTQADLDAERDARLENQAELERLQSLVAELRAQQTPAGEREEEAASEYAFETRDWDDTQDVPTVDPELLDDDDSAGPDEMAETYLRFLRPDETPPTNGIEVEHA